MKKILLGFTIFFFAGMFFLTLFAESIHNAALPKVISARPEQKLFPYEYTLEDGTVNTGSAEKIAVPKSMPEGGVYVIYSAEKNGTKRDFVRLTPVQTGGERDGYVEIVSGLMFSDRIVTSSTGELFDGCEVYVEK